MKNMSKICAWASFLAARRMQSRSTLLGRGLHQRAASGISGGFRSHGLTCPALAAPPVSGRRMCPPCFAPLWPAMWRPWAAVSGFFAHRHSVWPRCSRRQRSAAFGRRAGVTLGRCEVVPTDGSRHKIVLCPGGSAEQFLRSCHYVGMSLQRPFQGYAVAQKCRCPPGEASVQYDLELCWGFLGKGVSKVRRRHA